MVCEISDNCVLNVCKTNNICIVSKCSLETKSGLKEFVESGVYDVEISYYYNLKQPKPLKTSIILGSVLSNCFYCDEGLNNKNRTKDHVIPKCLGGKNDGNVVYSCKECNSDKGHLLLEQWLIKVRRTWEVSEKKNRVIQSIMNAIKELNK